MGIPSEFTSGLISGRTQVSSTYVIQPKTPTARNVATKLDDLGLYADMVRREGESITNFKIRLMRAQFMKGGTDRRRLTDAICNELSLGQAHMLAIHALQDNVQLDVTEEFITVSVSGYDPVSVPVISADVDGVWQTTTMSGLVSALEGTSGIQIQAVSGYEQMPAFLLEPQTSLVQVAGENVPRIQSYTLGILGRGDVLPGPVVTDSVSFTDTDTYRQQVDTQPQRVGEWTVNTSGRVNVFSVPQDLVLATYKFNLLGSGMTMKLVANGARLFNLASTEMQGFLFTVSGVGESARDLLTEVRAEDRNFWGK